MVETGRILLAAADENLKKNIFDGLNSKFAVEFVSGMDAAAEKFKHDSFDVVIAECAGGEPKFEGFIKELKKIDPDCVVIALAINKNEQEASGLMSLGAYDLFYPPLEMEKLALVIDKAVQMHMMMVANRRLIHGLKEHNVTLEKQNILLAKRIEESTKNLSKLYEDLHSTYLRTVKVLAQAIDARDHYTHSHSENVARYATAIAAQMGLSVKDTEVIREACELHDLGKIGIEDNILTKSGPLSKEEWEQIKRHPVIGAQILEPLTFLNDVTALVRQHHEHYDGTGYTEGRKGEDILLGARIIHLADAYESMRSARSYRKVPLSRAETVEEIKKNSGTQFDPEVVRAFLNIVDNL
ncbi:MAG: HD domain-containing protein [Candidatus Omnitrophota bacterium]|nr:HD domain-containing protein [Candidatus Omnitrophota bacterium]